MSLCSNPQQEIEDSSRMDGLTLGLGASGLGGVVILIVGWFIAKGIHSRCVYGGNEITLDIHRVAEGSTPAVAATVTSDSAAVVVDIPPSAAAVAVCSNNIPVHPIRIPKPKHMMGGKLGTPRVSKTYPENVV